MPSNLDSLFVQHVEKGKGRTSVYYNNVGSIVYETTRGKEPMKKYMLDGKELDPSVEYITIKVKVPIESAKNILDYRSASLSLTLMPEVRTKVKARLKVEDIKLAYDVHDIRIGLVYGFGDGNGNTYKVSAINPNNPNHVVATRIKANARGPAGELIWTTKEYILGHLNSGRAYVTGNFI